MDDTALLDAIDRFVARSVRPQARAHDQADIYPAALVEEMAALGLFGATIPEAQGGLGLSAATYARITARIAGAWMALTGIYNSHLIMAAAVARFGTGDQKRRFLPRFASGAVRGGVALTEPDCGTDLAAVRTRAVRDGAVYRVTGTKMWVSNGIHGGCFAVLVRTDPAPGGKGLSLLLMERDPAWATGRKLGKLGYRGIDTAELAFDGVAVPAENLIGGEEGRGLAQILAGLELGRINVAARGVGIAQAALAESLRYAQLRRAFGKPIAEHQAVQLRLADMAVRAEAARLLTEAAAAAYDRGGRCDVEAAIAKLHAAEAAVANAADALAIHGAAGYSTELEIERLYRDAPFLTIGEGTSDIQRLVIARGLVRRHPA